MKKWNLTYTIFGGFIFFSLLLFFINGFNQETNQILIRFSARISFLVFCLTFSASVLYKNFKNKRTKILFLNRRYLGVTFALLHLFHLSLIYIKDIFFESVFITRELKSLLPGIITYIFIILMLLTSFTMFSKKISPKQWSILHKIGGYIILLIFTVSYTSRILDGKLFYLPLFLIAISVWILKLKTNSFFST